MQLCFDATEFAFGLKEAVGLAQEKGLTALEYSFEPFPASDAGARKLTQQEKEYLGAVRDTCLEKDISIAGLKLNYPLKPNDKDSVKQFRGMIEKLAAVSVALDCKRIFFWLEPGQQDDLVESTEQALSPVLAKLTKQGLRLVLSISTPPCHRGRSLRYWRALEPGEWRRLLAGLPELGLSFSAAECAWQGIDYLKILPGIVRGIEHVEAADVEVNRGLLSDSGLYGPLWWCYRTPGKGQVDWRQLIEALKLYEFNGYLSIHLLDDFAQSDPKGLEEALDASVRLLTPLLKY